ncbi:MAG: hypothetical protein QG553_570 [Patescibacteria group bacterium]|jgi:7-cyano-7-deazaguanine synthase in queuosine biosynthesis|nr:hypothetical protein [Patescibacteria group bacterium]
MTKSAVLEKYHIEKDRLFFEANVMGRVFSTSIWYKNVDFHKLEREIGRYDLERLVAHIAAFEMNKYGSLHLDNVHLGDLTKYVDESFANLWHEIFLNVWGQWRYENNLPHDKPPKLIANSKRPKHEPISQFSEEPVALALFGGGKDSLVSTHLLSKVGLVHDILEYSSSIYGNRAEQSDVKALAKVASTEAYINELVVFDDFLDSPIIEYDGQEYKIHTLAAAETPASLFEAIPLAIYSGYSSLALGHEKSSNYPNLNWLAEESAPINHQWGKSLEAQMLLASYLDEHLLRGLDYYSTLMPLSDPAIFTVLESLSWDLVKKAHSCNVSKPWCRRCAKCVYVWLFYLAFLDAEKVRDEVFGGENLFDVEENHDILRMLAGKDVQTPFECVGQPGETLLALALCIKKGFDKPIVKELLEGHDIQDFIDTATSQLDIDITFLRKCNLPELLSEYFETKLNPILKQKAVSIVEALKN